jgi:hypothetical protein
MITFKNKRGEANPGGQIVLLLVMGVVLVLLVLSLFLWQLVGPPLVSTIQTAGTISTQAFQSTQDADIISAGASSITPAVDSLNNLEWVSYTLFTLLFLTFIIMCFFVRVYPFLVVFWIIIVVILFIASLYLTTTYQDMRTDPSLGYTSWENTDFMLRNLPVLIFVVGLVGGIVMYIIASKDKEIDAGVSIPI